MNPLFKSKHTILLSLISGLLFVGIPFANRYTPYTDTFKGFVDVWEVSPKDDPNYNYRLAVIIAGFVLTVLAFVILAFTLLKKNRKFFFLSFLLFLLIFSIGTKNYPYWANGLNYAQHGAGEGGYDPKAILPMTVFGEIWRSLVALFYLVCPITIVTTVILQYYYYNSDKERLLMKWQHVVVVILLIASFFMTPNYLPWLAD